MDEKDEKTGFGEKVRDLFRKQKIQKFNEKFKHLNKKDCLLALFLTLSVIYYGYASREVLFSLLNDVAEWLGSADNQALFILCMVEAILLLRLLKSANAEKFFLLARTTQVVASGTLSAAIFFALWFSGSLKNDGLPAALAALLISAPVAFTVWRFRDENQSKDINLKEFQKISEWVTGAHFGEAEKEKFTQKFSGSPENGELPLSEHSREFHQAAENKLALHTFSKRDGAVGLQIAAVYNLLPFYRGDYGRDFEKPAVHLLLSAWKVLQHDILQQLEQCNDWKKQEQLIEKLHQRADTPLGQAITRVLLACGHDEKPLLHRHQEVLAGICLSGMNFWLAGLEREILQATLFCEHNWYQAQLQGLRGITQFNFTGGQLNGVNFSHSQLSNTTFSKAYLIQTNFSNTDLSLTNFSQAYLHRANFFKANLTLSFFYNAHIHGASFLDAKLFEALFAEAELCMVNLLSANYLNLDNLLAAKNLSSSLIHAKYFTNLGEEKQKLLQDKEIIILHQGNKKITKNLTFKNEKGWKHECPAAQIPFPINLEKTRAANPDWQIDIE